MKKNYVLDTNVLLQDATAPLKFEDNNVYIPIVVIDELDHLKESLDGEVAYNARKANRILKALLVTKTLEMPKGGSIEMAYSYYENNLPRHLDPRKNDHIILMIADTVQQDTKRPTIVVSNDNAMMVKSLLFHVAVEEYKNQQIHSVYKGRQTKLVSSATIDKFYKNKEWKPPKDEFHPNEFVMLQSKTEPKKTALSIYKDGKLVALEHEEDTMCEVTPMKVGQHFAKEALMTPCEEIPLVIMTGPAGTAKTFLAMAAGLQKVLNGEMRQVLLLRPQSFFDSEIGFLPGDEQSKIDPLLRPFYDNLALILEIMGIPPQEVSKKIEELFIDGKLRAESFTYIRGRSITNSYIIIDEIQNASRTQVKGAITRAGSGSKIVLCGDPEQIDNPRLDAYNNGLTYAMNMMADSPLSCHITFDNSECRRSALAMDAAARLD